MARNRGLAVAGEVFVAAALRTSRSPSLPPLTVHHAFAFAGMTCHCNEMCGGAAAQVGQSRCSRSEHRAHNGSPAIRGMLLVALPEA